MSGPSLSTSSGNSAEFASIIQTIRTGRVENDGKVLRILLNDSNYAEIEYKKRRKTYDLLHTFIPEKYQGKGLGLVFAERIFDHLIAEDGVKLKLTCEYLIHFYEKSRMKYNAYITS